MPWDRWPQRGGVGQCIQEARESRGMTLAEAVARIAYPNIFVVRREIATPTHEPKIRALARSLTDQQIWDRAQTINILRLHNWEHNLPEFPIRVFDLAILADAFDYPIAFFRRDPVSGPDVIVHLSMTGDPEPVCVVCGFISHFLCDYVTDQNGGLCSKPLCEEHAVVQGHPLEDRHYCPAHADYARAIAATPPTP